MPGTSTPLHVPLGRTALRVSRLCLGTVNFGGRVGEAEGHALLDHALEAGVTFVDTADMYGWRVHRGYTEETIGRWLRASRDRRNEVVLATKVGNPVGEGPNDTGLSARHIVAACEASLRRLGTDWIDLYQLHTPDPYAHWDEIWQALDVLVAQGKVRYAGTSNFAGWQLGIGQEAARRRGSLGIVSEQCLYNLAARGAELEIVPAARALEVAVLVWSPLHGGLLGGVLAKERAGTAVKSLQGRSRSALDGHGDTIRTYEEFCAERGLAPGAVALAWVLSRPGVAVAVIGPRTPEQFDACRTALDLELDPADLERLDALFPPYGRGGPAPGAWID
jgi:NDP-hexose C3-ketoreductase / dTDP-4-oxo-2-deoxy-alpha-D-pentos-2-ene 2,3-reductase